MKPLPLLLAVLLFGIGTSCTDRTDRHQKALEELDRIIERRDAYGRTKNLRIAARRDELAAAKDPRKRIALAEEIYKEYYNYDIDSAYHYARRMLALAQSYGDGTRINCARVYLATTVLNGGMSASCIRSTRPVWHRQTRANTTTSTAPTSPNSSPAPIPRSKPVTAIRCNSTTCCASAICRKAPSRARSSKP